MIFNYEDLYGSGSSPYQRNPIYGSQEGPQAFDNEGRVEEPNKGRDLGQKLVNGTKIGLIFGGIFGVVNVIAKALSGEKVSKNDILWAVLPGSLAGTIHVLQNPGSANPVSPLVPLQFQNDQMRSVIEGIKPKLPELHSPQPKPQALQQSFLNQPVAKKNPEAKQVKIEEDPNALRWLNIMSVHPRILILGEQDSGKSALAYYLCEILHTRGPCYVYRLPKEGRNLIPPWLGVIDDLNKAPSSSTVVVDEAYLSFFARDSQSKRSKELTKIINLARQRDLSLIFVAHEARHIDLNVLSGIDTLIMKKPGPLQPILDRPILRSYTDKAKKYFENKTDGNKQRLSYVSFSSSGFEGCLENPKPSFWSEKLSKVFALGALSDDGKSAMELSKEEKKEKAESFHQYGWSLQRIADALGASKTTVYRWLNEGNGETDNKVERIEKIS